MIFHKYTLASSLNKGFTVSGMSAGAQCLTDAFTNVLLCRQISWSMPVLVEE